MVFNMASSQPFDSFPFSYVFKVVSVSGCSCGGQWSLEWVCLGFLDQHNLWQGRYELTLIHSPAVKAESHSEDNSALP